MDRTQSFLLSRNFRLTAIALAVFSVSVFSYSLHLRMQDWSTPTTAVSVAPAITPTRAAN